MLRTPIKRLAALLAVVSFCALCNQANAQQATPSPLQDAIPSWQVQQTLRDNAQAVLDNTRAVRDNTQAVPGMLQEPIKSDSIPLPTPDAAADQKSDTLSDVKPAAIDAAKDYDSDADNNDADDSAEGEGDEDGEGALDERFAEFQKQLDEIEESVDDVAAKAGNKAIVVSGTSKSTMKAFGRVHFDAWGFDGGSGDEGTLTRFNDGLEPQNRLGFRRLRIGVKGTVKDNMVYKIAAEFANGNSEFRDAYLGWSNLPVMQTLLLGNQKRPYGLDHLNSSRHNVFLERPFVIEAFNEDARRLGLASYNVSDDQAWNWRYGVYNQRNVQSIGNAIDDQLQLQIAGRLANTIWYDEVSGGRGYAHWAVAGTHADSSTNVNAPEPRFRTRPEARSTNRWLNTGTIAGADHYELIALEGVVNVGSVQVVSEYQHVFLDRDDGFSSTQFSGGYVYLSYFLTGEHMPWDRKSGTLGRVIPHQNFFSVDRSDGSRERGWGAWQIAARYSFADFSDEDVLGGEGDSFTFGLNWLWNPNARMQFNYINGRIENRDVGTGLGPENADYNIFGARFMVDF